METKAIIFGTMLLLAGPLWARKDTDVIVMENGDRMTGEVKGLDGGVLRINLDYIDGTVSVNWLKVARLESSQLFIVQTQDGSLLTGTIATAQSSAKQPITLQLANTTGTNLLIERSKVVRLEQTSESFWRRLSGEISLGSTYSKGNNAAQYNLTQEVEYLRERWGTQENFNSNLSVNKGADTSTRNSLTFSGYHLFPGSKTFFYRGFAGLLQSSTQGIRRQTNLGGGVGRYLKNTNRARLWVFGGLAWQSTNYKESPITVPREKVAAGVISTEGRIFLFKKTTLSFTGSLLPSISTPGRLYFNTDGSYYLKLFSNLSWNFSFYANWDSRPPRTFSGSDYGYSSGVKWTFGNR